MHYQYGSFSWRISMKLAAVIVWRQEAQGFAKIMPQIGTWVAWCLQRFLTLTTDSQTLAEKVWNCFMMLSSKNNFLPVLCSYFLISDNRRRSRFLFSILWWLVSKISISRQTGIFKFQQGISRSMTTVWTSIESLDFFISLPITLT